MNSYFWFFVASTACISITEVICSIGEGSFLETDAGFRRIQRNLLQENEGSDDTNDVSDGELATEKPEEPKVEPPKGMFEKGVDLTGPEIFYTGKVPFLMQVKGGVTVHRSGTTEVLGKATSIDGSNNIDGISVVSIDWKNSMLKLEFNKTNFDFKLLSMEYHEGNAKYNLMVRTTHGYSVDAPRGLAWACDSPGMFKTSEGGSVKGITLPYVRLQANFDDDRLTRFGPLWYCGEVMPIALWVGLIISLFFGFICFWGFSMLASINTMDRFDDPKGKQIYVPQTSD